jgi:AbrB family looped-hinge helix DNA binding protein
MTVKITLGIAGRIVLPKPLRDELHLAPGDALELESSGEEITLRPARGHARLKKKKGVWVYNSGEPLAADEVEKTLRRVRDERESEVLGRGR